MPRAPRPWSTVSPYLTPAVLRHFWARVKKGAPSACWPWQGATNQYGYGMVYIPGIQRPSIVATRIAYWAARGEMPDDRFVCHMCDNRQCCNPAHLWLGTHQQNLRDMHAKGRGGPWNKGLKTGSRADRERAA